MECKKIREGIMPTPVTVIEEATIKLKRQIRDHFNKTVHDPATLNKVAEVIKLDVNKTPAFTKK